MTSIFISQLVVFFFFKQKTAYEISACLVGSVRDQSFPEIYRSSELLQELRNPDGFGGRCGQCEFRTVCGGSRSHAFATTGDPLAEDPSCLYQPVVST